MEIERPTGMPKKAGPDPVATLTPPVEYRDSAKSIYAAGCFVVACALSLAIVILAVAGAIAIYATYGG